MYTLLRPYANGEEKRPLIEKNMSTEKQIRDIS